MSVISCRPPNARTVEKGETVFSSEILVLTYQLEVVIINKTGLQSFIALKIPVFIDRV